VGRSIGEGEVHVARVIKDAAAIRARGNFLIALHAQDDCHWQFHVATAADAVLNADQSGATFGAAQTLVTGARAFLDAFDELFVVAFEFIELAFETDLAIAESFDLAFDGLEQFSGDFTGGGDFLGGLLGLLHQVELLIFNLEDCFLAPVDFMGESAVFLVFLGLKLLERIFLDQLLFGFDFEFEIFAIGLDLFGLGFGGFVADLGGFGFFLESGAFGVDVGKFRFEPLDFAVAILENKEIFNDAKHRGPETIGARAASQSLAMMLAGRAQKRARGCKRRYATRGSSSN
jgi:hypothetical protein